MDTSGNGEAVWAQLTGSVYDIWANRYTANAGWGSAELLETDHEILHDARFPQIAADTNGNALCVWEQDNGGNTNTNIWANRYVAGVGWGTSVLIHQADLRDASQPQIAVDAKGNALAVWTQPGDGALSIWANRYLVGSGWDGAELIESNNATSASDPQIGIDAQGNAIAVWRQQDGIANYVSIWGNRYQ